MLAFFLLLLLQAAFVRPEPDVYVSYTLTCDSDEPFTFLVELVEKDWFTADDVLDAKAGMALRLTQGELSGSNLDLDFGHFYEFYLDIYHNCKGRDTPVRFRLEPNCMKHLDLCTYHPTFALD